MSKQRSLKLQVNMVPKTSWGINLRSKIPKSKWDKLRKEVHEKNGNKCQICGSTDRLSCHEHWHFDLDSKQQKLIGLGTICGMCHHATHFGRSIQLARQGRLDIDAVVEHFLRVNNCDKHTLKKHLEEAAAIFAERSKHAWNIDFGDYAHFVPKGSS